MGFDPSRPQRKGAFEYSFVAGAIVVGILLVIWAFFG
jgi:hypothetical protein